MFDFSSIMNFKNDWETFKYNHAKVPEFINNVRSKGFCENQEIAIAIRYPDGTEYKAGIRVRESDLAAINDLRALMGSMK